MTDEPRDDQGPDEQGPENEAPEEQGPAPATWAGKRRSGGDEAGEHEIPADIEGAAPDDAGEAPDEADEAEEPPDEFDFDEEEPDEEDEDGAQELEEELDELDELDEEPSVSVPASQETIEADTLTAADSEEAKEAALAGLRARTAEHAAKRAKAGPATEEGAAVTPPPPVVPAPAKPAQPTQPDSEADEDSKPPRRAVWPRFVAASFLIVVSMATATAVSLLVYLTDIAKGLGGLNVEGLTAVEAGKPQNFLILGSDKRADTPGDPGRSDTTILLRINPDLDVITMMSIPRDLKVNIPGHGPDKFNAAYSYGGPQKTLKTVQQLTKERIPINHIVNVDFIGFADAVDAIGCVYIDVDRHYYIPPDTGTAEIDVQAGYQRLCGLKALQYVRYRHTDTDLVRSARQQDFLREARQAVPPSKLLDDYDELTDILKKYTDSDIDGPATLLNLGKLVFAAKDAPVQEVHFPTTSLGDSNGYVTSNSELVQKAVSQFLNPTGVTTSNTSSSSKKGGKGGSKGSSKGHGGGGGEKSKPKPPTPPPPPPAPLVDSTASGQQYAELFQNTQHKDSGKPLLNFPIFYPTMLTPGSTIDDESRAFVIDGPSNDVYYGYKFVVAVPGAPGAGFPTAYYGVSGTNWKDPPILANPSEEREVDGRTYQLFYDGDRLRLVSFKTDQGSYWVINSLTQQLSAGQMLGIAQNVREYTG